MASILAQKTQLSYVLHAPEATLAPILLSSPHSGRNYTNAFLQSSPLDILRLRNSEDAYVDEFLHHIEALGLTWIEALTPRAFVDLNRSERELDPLLIFDKIPSHRIDQTHRVASGLGVIPRVVSSGLEIYAQKLSLEDITLRLNEHYHPYHAQLSSSLKQLHTKFGHAVLLDIHSMPSRIGGKKLAADVVIGDNYGKSCSPWLTNFTNNFFKDHGLKVAHNTPFAGGYITTHYGTPHKNIEALQIEFRRDLYMCEQTLERKPQLSKLQLLMHCFAQELKNIMMQNKNQNIAAE